MNKRLEAIIMKCLMGVHKMHRAKLVIEPKMMLVSICGGKRARFMTITNEDITCKKCKAALKKKKA